MSPGEVPGSEGVVPESLGVVPGSVDVYVTRTAVTELETPEPVIRLLGVFASPAPVVRLIPGVVVCSKFVG